MQIKGTARKQNGTAIQKWNSNFRNETAVKGTAVKKLNLVSSTLSILGINLHTKKSNLLYK